MLAWFLGANTTGAATPAALEHEADGVPNSESRSGYGALIRNETPSHGQGAVKVRDNLYLALCDLTDARVLFKDQLASTKFAFMLNTTPKHEARRTQPQTPAPSFCPGKFEDIANFCVTLNRIRRKFPQVNLVICTGNHADAIAHSTFLAASYMLLWEQSTLDQALSILRPESAPISASMAAALRAVHQARYEYPRVSLISLCIIMFRTDGTRSRCLNWIDLHADAKAPSGKGEVDRIFLDEYLHFDNPCNAGMHVLVPGKLLAFPQPVNIGPIVIPGVGECPVTWIDVDNKRRFSPKYFAEIFDDWEVKLVLRCKPSNYDFKPFADRGIGVEEFPGLDRNMNLFQHMDRLVTLSRLAGGYMAVECGGEGLGHAEILVTAFLMRMYKFDADAALAWVQLMHPGTERPGLRFSLKLSDDRLRRCRSLKDIEIPSDDGLLSTSAATLRNNSCTVLPSRSAAS